MKFNIISLTLCTLHRFTFCQYPFILSTVVKKAIIQRDSEQQMISMARVRVCMSLSFPLFTAELPECAENVTVETKDLDCLVLRVSWDTMLALWPSILKTVYLSCLYLDCSQ